MLLELQKKINHLLYCYYTIVGVIQRDFARDDIEATMKILCDDLRRAKEEIDQTICTLQTASSQVPEELVNNIELQKAISDADDHIDGGKELIDHILKMA